MARIRMDATNLPSVARAMKEFGPHHDAELGERLRAGMKHAKAHSQKIVRKRSRRLMKSIYTRVTKNGKRWQGNLGANTPYARIREKGGVIRPKKGEFLVFPGRNGGLVKVREVTQKATPYIKPAITHSRPMIVKEIRGGMERSRDKVRKAAN